MNSSRYLRNLAGQLKSAGLPPVYVQRVVDELTDHQSTAEDVQAGPEHGQAVESKGDSEDIERRLGDVSVLADQYVHHFRRRTLAGRYPFLAVFVAPLILAPLVVVAYGVGLITFYTEVLPAMGIDVIRGSTSHGPINELLAGLLPVLHRLATVAPFFFTIWLTARWAAVSGRGQGWLLAGCLAQCLLCAACYSHLTLPDGDAGQGSLSIGLGLTSNLAVLTSQLANAAAGLVIALLCWRSWFWRPIRFQESIGVA